MPQKTKSPISAGNFKVLETFSWKDDKRIWVLLGMPCRFSRDFLMACICGSTALTLHFVTNYTCQGILEVSLCWIWNIDENMLGGGRCFGLVDAHFVPQHSLDKWPSHAVLWCLTSLRGRKMALTTLPILFFMFPCISDRIPLPKGVHISLPKLWFILPFVSFCQQSLI